MRLYLAALVAFLFTSTSNAHPFFKKQLELKGRLMSVECSACHVKKDSKLNYQERNEFGKLFERELAGKKLLEQLKKVKDLPPSDGDRIRVETEVAKEFAAGWNAISKKSMRKGLTYSDAFVNGFVAGALLRPLVTQGRLSDENRLLVNSTRTEIRYRSVNQTRIVDGKQKTYTVKVPVTVEVRENFELPLENVQIYSSTGKLLSAADARFQLSGQTALAFVVRRSQDQAKALKQFPKFVKDFKNNTRILVMVAPEDWQNRGKK